MLIKIVAITVAFAGEVRHKVTEKEAPRYKIVGGNATAQLYLNEDTGAKEIALTKLTLNKGAAIAEHVHDSSAEILYIQEGRVEMTIAGHPLSAGKGDSIYIPAGVKHSAVATTRVIALQIYAGPGPEQRFKTITR